MALKKLCEITEVVIVKSITKSDKKNHYYLLTYKICKNWELIVAKEIAQMLSVKAITNDINKKKKLILKLNNQAYAAEASIYRLLIQERVNSYFGYEIISNIMII